MRWLLAFLTMLATIEPLSADGNLWVGSERLDRRTCPSTSCGIVGTLMYREAAKVFEIVDGWGRVSPYYDASCSAGVSAYVDSGNNACTAENGVTDGRFAEWVLMEFLVENRPTDPAVGATGIAKLIAQSDDIRRYKAAFVKATESLIDAGTCTPEDFLEMGGWVKSTTHRNKPVYFTYCGGMTTGNRLYLDVDTGQVFR